MPPHCIICGLSGPHKALRIACTSPECHLYLCGTIPQRRCCVSEFFTAFRHCTWNEAHDRVDFGRCVGANCAGFILSRGVEPADQGSRIEWNAVVRNCDWFQNFHYNEACDFFGTHSEIDAHINFHEIPNNQDTVYVHNPNFVGSPSRSISSDLADDDDDDDDVDNNGHGLF